MSPMPLSLDEVEDLIDSWELDPDVDTVGAGDGAVRGDGRR